MTRLASAFMAATVSRVFVAGLTLIAMPIYYKLLGAENFGVIGFFLSLQVMVNFLDLGLGATLIRKFSHTNHQEPILLRSYASTFEAVYLSIAVLVALILIASSQWLSHTWIQASERVLYELPNQLKIAALCICCIWFSSIYNSMLIGLEQQFKLSVAQAILAILRFGIPMLAVTWQADLTIFFWANLSVAILQILILKSLTNKLLPRATGPAKIDFKLIRLDAGFSMGMFGIFLTTFIITQTDKLILSTLLTLPEFGVYTLCTTLASGIYLAVQPLFNVLLPRFSRLFSDQLDMELQALYGLGAQLMALIVVPISALIFFFSKEILQIWTMQHDVVEQGALLLKILVLANAVNALMNLPYCLQVASGWTSLPLKVNYVAILLIFPIMIYAANRMGSVGAVFVMLLMHICILCVIPHIMHSKLLINFKWEWYLRSVFVPAITCGLLLVVARQFWPFFDNRWFDFFSLLILLLLATIATFMSLIDLRKAAWRYLASNRRFNFLRN